MKKFVLALAGLALFVAPASAAELRLFLSTTGLSNGSDVNSAALAPPTGTDPTLASPARLYLWAQMLGTPDPGQKWNGVSVHVGTTGTATITSYNFWNFAWAGGALKRWTGTTIIDPDTLATSDGPMTDSIEARLAAALDQGVNDSFSGAGDTQTIVVGGFRGTLIGYVEFAGVGTVQLQVGNSGISRSGGPAAGEGIRLGWDNPSVLNGRNDKNKGDGVPSAEATLTPEPASLLLLGLGALALRRR